MALATNGTFKTLVNWDNFVPFSTPIVPHTQIDRISARISGHINTEAQWPRYNWIWPFISEDGKSSPQSAPIGFWEKSRETRPYAGPRARLHAHTLGRGSRRPFLSYRPRSGARGEGGEVATWQTCTSRAAEGETTLLLQLLLHRVSSLAPGVSNIFVLFLLFYNSSLVWLCSFRLFRSSCFTFVFPLIPPSQQFSAICYLFFYFVRCSGRVHTHSKRCKCQGQIMHSWTKRQESTR